MGPSVHKSLPYDTVKDFAPIGLIASAPSLLLIHPSLPVRSVVDLIAAMKNSKPAFQVGVPGISTVNRPFGCENSFHTSGSGVAAGTVPASIRTDPPT